MKLSKRDNALAKYVMFSIFIVVLYSVFEFIFALKTGIAHDTLTTCVYAFFGGEIVTCGLIKIFKIKKEI